jgi:4,5-dihydroxyphthalate decarboxylase
MKLRTLLGDYPVTRALKEGAVRSPHIEFDFADVKVPNTAFKRVVRGLEFDVAELAIVTFLMAKAHGKPLALLPAVMFGRFQHPYLVYNAERGTVSPRDLEGRRVAIRSSSVTTVAWIRGILADDHGVNLDRVKWVTFEDAHVAEYRDPPGVERAAEGKTPLSMLLAGEVDAAVLAEPLPKDERLKSVIPDPAAAAADWQRRNGALQINHMVVVRQSLAPEVIREVFDLLFQSKRISDEKAKSPFDTSPFGLEANRRNLEVAIDYVHRQKLIPRRYAVDELFDNVTRLLGA